MPEETSRGRATETPSWLDPLAAAGDTVLESVEGCLSTAFGCLEGLFHRRPFLGAILTGGSGLGAVLAVGVAEVIFTLGMGYVGYRMFAYRESFTEAVATTVGVRQGKLPPEEDPEL